MFAKGIFMLYVDKMNMGDGYIWKTSFQNEEEFPHVKLLPNFYTNMVIGFNGVKCIKVAIMGM